MLLYTVYLGEILFDRLHPSLPPDIICSSEDESFDPDLDNLKVIDSYTIYISL